MAGHNDPRLLYSIPGVHAYHIQDGEEAPLTPSGPQTLSLLMVPTSSPFSDLSTTAPQSAAPEEDFYLHLHLPPELDLPLPATTQIYHKPPYSYLIPRWDLTPDSGAFTRIEFQPLGTGPGKTSQEDIDTFETILAQCTAFLERAVPPTPPRPGANNGVLPAYNPADYAPGATGSVSGGQEDHQGHIVLVDEEDGSVVGELSENFNIVEDPKLQHGSKNPVEITMPEVGNDVLVQPADPRTLHPAYAKSSLVSGAASASRLIITTSTMLSNAMQSGANAFTQRVKPAAQPMTFSPTTHARVRKLNNFSASGLALSSKTVGQINKYAQNVGASFARRSEKAHPGRSVDPNHKPGMLNKSMMAFSTIADGIDFAGRQLLASGSAAANTMVGHRYGEDARKIANNVTGSVRHVALVYVDAAGVSRRAVVKSVAKGMVVGRVKGGGDLVVGAGDGGVVPAEAKDRIANEISQGAAPPAQGFTPEKSGWGPDGGYGAGTPDAGQEGYGTYGFSGAGGSKSGPGESLYGQPAGKR